MDPSSGASKAYRNIVRRVLGESVPLMTLDKQKPGFFAKLKSMFKK